MRRESVPVLLISCVLLTAVAACHDGHGESRLKLGPCHLERLPEQVLCGVHQVFEDREAQRGRRIPVHVAVLPALRRAKEPDPLFLLAGGPGQGARSYAAAAVRFFRAVRRNRDLVLVDLRGTGASRPLKCPAPDDTFETVGTPLGAAFARQCLAAIDADVRRYTHRDALADLDEIRHLLGYERINLWGGSWGTRAALLYSALYPAAVRSVVLDGAAPLTFSYPLDTPADAQQALDLLVARCRRDAGCDGAFPNLRETIVKVLNTLAARPATVSVAHPRTGEPRLVTLTRDHVAEALRVFLYVPDDSAFVPALFARAARNDFGPLLTQVVRSAAWSTDTMALGTTLAILCTEDVAAIDAARGDGAAAGSFLGSGGIRRWHEACAEWPRGTNVKVARAARLRTPALILSGGLDPVTPPRWGEAMAGHFTDASHVVVNGAAHNVSFSGCVPDLIAQFVQTGSTRAIDRSCVDTVVPRPFVLSHAGHQP